MLHAILIPIAVFLLALGTSYAITRPIGDSRRYIASTIFSVGLGTIGGFVATDMFVGLGAALAGAFLGMMIAWRRRNPLSEPPRERSKARRQSSRRPHYGITRG
jgi:hypothetical protein